MIGNKIDLCENDENRVVKFKDGEMLANVSFLNTIQFLNEMQIYQEYETLFFETSTKANLNILNAVEAMTRF